jgi:hypothetical protein
VRHRVPNWRSQVQNDNCAFRIHCVTGCLPSSVIQDNQGTELAIFLVVVNLFGVIERIVRIRELDLKRSARAAFESYGTVYVP